MRLELDSQPVEIQAAEGKGPPRFSGLAYTGAPMRVSGYRHPVVIDLQGVESAGDNIPMLRGHDDDRIVGHSDSVRVDAEGVHVTGVVSGTGVDANEVRGNARNGYRWQMSVGADPVGRSEFIKAGDSANVNGRTINGPAEVFRRVRLSEISFVARGADGATSSQITGKEKTMGDQTTELTPDDTATEPDPIQLERDRCQKITENCSHQPEIAAKAISEGWTLDKAELEVERANLPKPVLAHSGRLPAIHSKSRLPDSGLRAVEAALLVRAGHHKMAEEEFGDQVLDSMRGLERASLPDLLRTGIQASGGYAPHDMDSMIRAAFSTHELSTALSNVAHLSLISAFREHRETFKQYSQVKSASDFKEHTGVRFDEKLNLERIAKEGEFKHGTAGEDTYTYQVDTYGKRLSVDRQDLINDNINIFQETAPALGRAAARMQSDVFYKTLLSAGSGYFNGTIGNAGTAPLDATSLGAAVTAMRLQRDSEGNDLDFSPSLLLVPPELEFAAKSALESEFNERVATAADIDEVRTTGNPQKSVVRLEVEQRLSNTTKFSGTAASASTWYLFGAAADMPMVYAYLQGRTEPFLETFDFNQDPRNLAFSWRIYHDFGAALAEPRAAYRSVA